MPLAYQTWEGRYDDPDRTWHTLHLASDAYGAWVEVLERFRPHDDLMTALKDITDEDGDPDTLRWLAQRLPEVLVRCGVRDLDLSAATGPQRELTQAIARELYLHGDAHAIEYPSRYGETIRCIAMFETDGDLPDIKPISTPYGRRWRPMTTPWRAPCDSTACRGSCSSCTAADHTHTANSLKQE